MIQYPYLMELHKTETACPRCKSTLSSDMDGAWCVFCGWCPRKLPAETARKILRISQRQFWNVTGSGKLVATKVDGCAYFDESRVRQLAEDNEGHRITRFSVNRLASASEAAERTGYSRQWIGVLCRRGDVRGRKIGNTWHVELETVDSYRVNTSRNITVHHVRVE